MFEIIMSLKQKFKRINILTETELLHLGYVDHNLWKIRKIILRLKIFCK